MVRWARLLGTDPNAAGVRYGRGLVRGVGQRGRRDGGRWRCTSAGNPAGGGRERCGWDGAEHVSARRVRGLPGWSGPCVASVTTRSYDCAEFRLGFMPRTPVYRLQRLLRDETVSGCACQGHVWTTGNRPLTMPGWRAATAYQPRPPSSPVSDANRRTSCGRQPTIRPTGDGSWGWSGARTGEARDVPDHAFRRHMTAIVRPMGGGGALGQPPEKQDAQLPTCASYHLSASKLCSGCRLRGDRS